MIMCIQGNTQMKERRAMPEKPPAQQSRTPAAKKSLGQNFLQDANIARKIVGLLEISRADRVMEIGPGPGALTRHIHPHGPEKLVLVEKDDHWARHHAMSREPAAPLHALGTGREQDFAALLAGPEQFLVLEADALKIPWHTLSGRWKLVGNLPYNVASPLMWDIFSRAGGLERAVFMVQKEVGQRLAARPGTPAYGALSVWVQSFVTPVMEFIVPPQVFHPRPKVHSAVLSFVPLENPPDFHPEKLAGIIKKCFQLRRKQLGTIFKGDLSILDLLKKNAIDNALRPENLAPQQFQSLAKASFFQRKD